MGRRKKQQQFEEEYYSLSPQTRRLLMILFLGVIALISILSFLDMAGAVGVLINGAMGMVFGITRVLFPLIMCAVVYYYVWPEKLPRGLTMVGILLILLSLNGLFHSGITASQAFDRALLGQGGGVLGYVISYPLQTYLGYWAGLLLLIAIGAAGALIVLNSSMHGSLLGSLFRKKEYNEEGEVMEEVIDTKSAISISKAKDEEEAEDEVEEDIEVDEALSPEELQAQRRTMFAKKVADAESRGESMTDKAADSKYKNLKIDLPVSLLLEKKGKPRSGDIALAMERIETTLSNFGIDVEMGEVSIGPTVTQYTLKPQDGVKVARITALSNDLALALAAHPIRIEAPIPGKALIGIEVPNHSPATVGLREIVESKGFRVHSSGLGLALGKDVSGNCWTADLTKMPHLLVAGATGSGKSVCLNGFIVSLLYQNNPDTLRLIMIDPKRVEFPVYNGIPHLLTPVVTDVTKAVNALRWAIQEMDKRFDILAKAGVRNIASFNQNAETKMPYLVIVIDELADLMITASNEVEASIIRLTQMARAVGIHMILATQRPSVDVITGLIKANVPARIAFSVASSMDSRTILDSVGAEKLIGKGDMLFQTAELGKPRRIQGAYVSDDEIKRVADFLKQAGGEPEYDDAVTQKTAGKSSFDFGDDGDDGDELLQEAKEVVVKAGKASASYLQRRFRIGYARAARLLDLLEEHGVIGPGEGAKPREVMMRPEDLENEKTPTVFKKSFEPSEPVDEVDVDAEEESDVEDEDIPIDDADVPPPTDEEIVGAEK